MPGTSSQEPDHAGVFVHETADVAPTAMIGSGTKIWAHAQVREGARIGRRCVLGRNCFVGLDVEVGDDVKVQNNASLYEGLTVDDGAFIGPHVVFTNDKVPRAVNPDGSLKSIDDWELGRIHVGRGAAIGASAVIVTGTSIGEWAMVGSGSVVTRDVPDHALVLGNPARAVGWVSAAGARCASQEEARNRSADEGDRRRLEGAS
jgi:UDP-2-acetamido-3-amino-2,3-dideoxy-glucuronate N-acetyltransferase